MPYITLTDGKSGQVRDYEIQHTEPIVVRMGPGQPRDTTVRNAVKATFTYAADPRLRTAVIKTGVTSDEIAIHLRLANVTPQSVPRVIGYNRDARLLVMELWPYSVASDLERVRTRRDVANMFYAMRPVIAVLFESQPPLLHNDLQPRNVFFNDYGDFVLADFGSTSSHARRKNNALGLSSSRFRGGSSSPPPPPSPEKQLIEYANTFYNFVHSWDTRLHLAGSDSDLPPLSAELLAMSRADVEAIALKGYFA